ncbi:cyclopropane-fatty-acyl-phospholipid synthase family protein [Arthrobacter sp. CAN_C5]|uniref:SAM-dependent methyltransferase n=1 Tax=Arthrobacter sp. CAN_C5 TaxID=2760706 RepID=UPI001AE9E5EE|nr:cyclopropane-fatty-acyl-phospholipid synthase family protein [Arthrobacter sp. CAN_C5]MBP2217103.1 cyclopropane-fatty-acyl-phospholipid synthase [Arthrobacter sp. CAN_C5]
MTKASGVAPLLAKGLSIVLGAEELPIRVRGWDGSEAGPAGAPILEVRSNQALRRLLWSPGQLGLSRAYAAGEIEVPGDLFAGFRALSSVGKLANADSSSTLDARSRWRLLRTAARLGAIGPEPAPPAEEADLGHGRRHSHKRDAAAISHHYDVGNDFYSLILGPSMVYSCAVWNDERTSLESAQEAKLDLVCRKLGLKPGMRLLDVGCGWGSMALHAAQRYGVDVVGVTLSVEQSTLARQRMTEAGLADHVDIRVQDYREVMDGPFDAISSIGMSEHVGRAQIADYVTHLKELLHPGGRLLNHAISWNAGPTRPDPDSFIARYIFPDGELLTLTEIVGALESDGLEVLDVESLRQHYGLTLRAWVQRLEEHWDEAVQTTSKGQARVWRLYMAASALAFESGKMGVNQVLVQRPGGSPPPMRRTAWASEQAMPSLPSRRPREEGRP